MRRSLYVTAVLAGIVSSAFLATVQLPANAHCEVPCGIYADYARVDQMLEDTTTIAKATDQIRSLAGKHDIVAVNQATRWINTKEDHATRIQQTIAQYFLTQRVKPKPEGSDDWNGYVTSLAEHHAVMVAAMKTKQTVDPNTVTTLRRAIERIAKYYPAPHTHPQGG